MQVRDEMPLAVGRRKRKCVTAALFGLLFFSLIIAPFFVCLVRADPLYIMTLPTPLGTRWSDGVTKPPVILISAPENNTLFAEDSISLSINVSVGESTSADLKYIGEVYYTSDWQTNETIIYSNPPRNPDAFYYTSNPQIGKIYGTVNLTGIPDGNHSLVVYAKEMGTYYAYTDHWANGYDWEYYWNFKISASSSIFFTVDTTAPCIVVLSMQNTTFNSSDVDLNFTVNEQTSRTSYSLDGNVNRTIAGNTTLTALPFGDHNLTVYAWDPAGNVGASETITFTIAEPFPTVAVAAGATVTAVGAVLLVYFKKHKK